jgi:hypothetical protein
MSELLQAADGLHQQLVELLAALTYASWISNVSTREQTPKQPG